MSIFGVLGGSKIARFRRQKARFSAKSALFCQNRAKIAFLGAKKGDFGSWYGLPRGRASILGGPFKS